MSAIEAARIKAHLDEAFGATARAALGELAAPDWKPPPIDASLVGTWPGVFGSTYRIKQLLAVHDRLARRPERPPPTRVSITPDGIRR
ncbi:MAG: hypothetical protein H0V44_04200 [Planctomycetes bacterium]|nr:hypothetical protein [Planctomycetota bacterium]